MRYAPDAVSPNVLGGHSSNSVGAGLSGQTVAGGGRAGATCYEPSTGTLTRMCRNQTTNSFASVGGGEGNFADHGHATVAGGEVNTASGWRSTVSGGRANTASAVSATVAGGSSNKAAGNSATIGGGVNNIAGEESATVGGGDTNQATLPFATVAGGYSNSAGGDAAAVPGGRNNSATGATSFAAGDHARATHDQSFVWSGWSSHAGVGSFYPNYALIAGDHGLSVDYYAQRLDGGGTRWVYIGDEYAGATIATWTGAYLSDAGVWTNVSDREAKGGFIAVDARQVLEKVATLPIARWHYKAEGQGVAHVGPVAQDFHAAFGLGSDDKHITTVDADGVALAAIQGLNAKIDDALRRKDDELARLRAEVAEIRATLAEAIAGGSRLARDDRPRPNADGEALP